MNPKRVTVLRGGPSEEYEVSLRTGANVLTALRERYASVDDVIITKRGEWLIDGIARSPEKAVSTTDVVFIALHGTYGEDGEIQRLIERYQVPFTGSRSLPSAIAFNKHLTKETLSQYGVMMPQHKVVTLADLPQLDQVVHDIRDSFGPTYVVKPLASGSSFGVTITSDPAELTRAIADTISRVDYLMVEEFITGREATCAVLNDFRDQDTYVFPIIEIIPPTDEPFFTTAAKYNGKTQEICPGNFSYQERSALTDLSSLIHRTLGLTQYSRSDFIIKNGVPYFLEVNTLPGLTKESLFPKAAASVGLSFTDLVEHLVETAGR